MVRETRHLWVGNLPENIREDRIREHFKRYGRVQSVKLLPRGEECPVDGGSSGSLGEGNEGGSGSGSGGGGGSSTSSGGASATVAFMDIKSAAKAHATEHTLDERALTTQYYEPQHLQHRFPSHGSSEDHGPVGGGGGGGGGTSNVSGGNGGGGGVGSTGTGVGGSVAGSGERERGGESFDSRGFYGSERSNRVGAGSGNGIGVGVVGSVGGGGGGGGVVGGHPTDPSTGDPVGGYIPRGRPPLTSSYHVTSSRARDRLYPRTGPYVSDRPPPPPHLDRHRGSLPPSSWSTYESTSSRYGNAPPPPSPATNDAYQDEQGGGGGGGSSSSGALRQHKKQRRKSRSGSSSPSGSSRSGSSSSSRSGSSGGSTTGGSTSAGSSPHRTSNVAVTEDRRALAICVRNLPTRSSDTSLKDGLFHEYKKHGKVTWVKVVGVAGDRYALVCFKKPEDVEKALEVSHDKLFFGCKIEVAPYQGYDVDDNEFRPYEAELDEYHPKATRTLFIGNLEKDVTASELRKHFEPFGEIIEIDIKKQGAVSSYAFCQYSDIGSVVKAMRSMDGEHLGTNRIKLGFGKSMPTACVWVDGLGDISDKYINLQFHQFGLITQMVINRERGQALVFFDQINCAQAAVKEMRGVVFRGRRLQVDFASRECQETFFEHIERQANNSEKSWDSRPSPAPSFDVTIPFRRERGSFDSTVSSSCSRFTRYDTPPRSRTASYSRTSGGSTPGASPAHPTAMSRSSRRSYQDSYYDGDYGEPTSRRFRSYDEYSQGSGASHDDYQSSVLSDGKLNDDDCPPPSRRHAVQSVVTSVDPPAPPPPLLPPPDIRHLQKERVHLLEQLEECHSSGDEIGFVPKKRTKLDSSSSTILCEDDEPEIASLLVTSHSSRKGMDFRRVSDSKVVVHHSTRRNSCEGRGPGPCKRRRDATSRHHEHHDGSRPGTPLVDERPENLVPSEPRRFRERSHEGPLSLPLPRFAAQMLNNNNNTSSSNNNNGSGSRSSGASLAKVASPPCASFSTAPSPRAAPQPPASPPPRHPSSSPTSSDSETAPQSPSLEERIRSLDEKYEKWSGSRALSSVGGDAMAKIDASTAERFRFRHKLLDMALHEVQPSDIVKSVLAKRSVFDEDSKRLENYNEKYEPREFTGIIGIGSTSMIGSTAGLTSSSSCTSKVCLQYPFPSHPPVQLSSSGTSITNMVGVNTSLSTNLTPTTTMVTSAMKTDPRIAQHNCIHPTPATPITPGTSIKTVSPELPPVSLPIGLGSGTLAGSGNNSLLSSNGSVGSIHNLGASTHRGLSISGSTASPTTSSTSTSTSSLSSSSSSSCSSSSSLSSSSLSTLTSTSTSTSMSTDAFTTVVTTTAVPVTISSTVTSAATTTTSVIGTTPLTTTTSSIAPPSSITSLSNSSSSSSLSTSSTDLPRSRLRKESSASSRESRDSRDGKDSRESKHSKGKDCQRRLRKEETDVERNRKDRDERESSNVVNDISEIENHSKDFKDNKELRYERKDREEKERRDKEDRDKQDRREKEDRDRQERKEREEREKREKDEERRERERLDKERQEKDRREREERERERKEREENELKEKERREKERIERERREREEKDRQERREREERERRERERKEREEREERERKEREIRLEREKQEKERLRREKEEQEKKEKEERDRLERERRREEKERLERERKREREEKERIERERRKEKEEREKIEKEKREKEERERLEREKHERDKRKEREDQERRDKEKVEREKRRDREEKDKDKRERDDNRRQLSLQQSTENHVHSSITSQSQTQTIPAPVSMKRRCSSQDGPPDEDAKRMKISDHRRDSKDRSRQNRKSEDRKHRNDSHRSNRESRESRDSKESSGATQDNRDGTGTNESTRESNSRDNGKEKQKIKKNRSEKEPRERSPRVLHEPEKEFLSRLELPKSVDSSLSNEQAPLSSNHTRDSQHHQQQQSTLNLHSDIDDGPLSIHEMQVARHPSATDTDSDEPKKHSIFDIVDDEPAYISMYDKVKARSTKNMQKLEEEKRQVRLKDKFSQLKQSRARREEKKQSTSWDGDSVSSKALTEDEATSESDSTRTKSLSRKGSRSRIHSDTSEEEEPFNNKVRKAVVKSERFLESDVDLGFADTEEKQNRLEVSSVIVNSVHSTIKEEPRISDEEKMAIEFHRNRPMIDVMIDYGRNSRKKSHKKKQKRQKNSIAHENSLKVEPADNTEHKSKTNVITTPTDCRPNHGAEPAAITTSATSIVATSLENAEERLRVDKKQRSKKDKRRDRNGEDKAKARRKRLNRQEARDSQRMEDIFGPLSDDVDDGPTSNTFFNRFGNMTSENSVYASDSDGGRSSLDMDRMRRKTEKKRRHQPEDENSVDLAEAGREIEAKLLGIPSSPKVAVACNEPNDHDVFRFTDDNDSIEPSTPSAAPEKVKEKKKKRKRSKEERSRKDYHHHHHHHHHHHEKSSELPYLGAEPSPPRASSPLISKTMSPTLPTPRDALPSPIPKATSNVSTASSITPPVVSNIQTPKSEKKKDKLIPGFGIEIDETIHENAVKSISEPDERDGSQSRSGREEPEVPVATTPPTQSEDKPRVAISQEETEDAVAALLEETFGASTEDFSYEGEEEEAEADGVTGTPTEAPQEDVDEMQQAVESLNASTGDGDADLKPDTPQSEHDLQIDTDTDQEDPNYETFDLSQPPKTPDIPSFYKSPTKTLNMTSVLTASEKPIEMRLLPAAVAKPQSPPPSSVIAHSWNLNEHKPRESVRAAQVETAAEPGADIAASPERVVSQADQESSLHPPSQYKQAMLGPCSVPITSEVPKLPATSPRPSPITVQPLYQRLPVSPQSQMVPSMRQASPKTQNVVTVPSSSSTTNTATPLPQLGPSRIPPLVPSQLSPRVSQPLSPNGQWSRNPTLSPHVPNVSKPSPPTTRIAVCVPISAQRLEAPVQQIYSTAATQQPVIQHASGMLAPASGYPRGGLPPLTLNIPSRPFMPVSPLAPGMQVKSSRDSSLSVKSVIETLLPVNPNEPPQRLEEPKLSPAVIPESTNKASTSPKVPSPNQPPTYIPETAKIEINASTSSPVFGKPPCVNDSYMSSRTQKQIPVSITTDSNLLSPRQKQELSNLQLLTTHVPRSSTPSPVIVAHGQSHLCHNHSLCPPTVSSPNQSLIKTVVPIVSQQITSNTQLPSEKCVISQTSLPLPCSRPSSVTPNQLAKSHVVPPVSQTVSQTIIARVVPSISTVSAPSMNEQTTPECLDSRIAQAQQLELDAEAQIGQTAQPMQLTPPVQSIQPIDEIKQEPIDIKEEDIMDEAKYNVEFEKALNQPCIEDNAKIKQEKQEIIKTEIAPCVPKVEVADTIIKLEPQAVIKTETTGDIKEEDTAKENDEVELNEESVEDPLKEPSTDPLAIDPKEDATDSKEDSDYWSAKEVNIESVIKKVDALCDGEGNDADDGTQPTENSNTESHDTSKNESDWFDSETTENESKKSFTTTDDHDEGVETCENESTRSRRGRAKSRRGCRGGVTTRRGSRNVTAAVTHKRGGRSPRGSKHHVEKNKLPADVYEFHDDSEEDNAGRPRLILTIKSPGPNVTGSNAQPATPVAAVKEIPLEEFVSPAANTRKSRRLAEKDGSRNTIDDVIEDVVRGPVNKSLTGANTGNVHATRRSTRHNNSPRNVQAAQQPTMPLTELRKSPRGGRKAARRTSENNEDSGEEKLKEPATAVTVSATAPREETPSKEETKLTEPESPKTEEPTLPVTPTPPQKRVSLEPMTLIDPVTGDLIPMRESEEGQYIPVSTTSGQAQVTNRTQGEPRNSGTVNTSPGNETPRAKSSSSESALLVSSDPKKEVVEHAPCQPTVAPIQQQKHPIQQQVQPQTSVITKPQSPTVQVTSTITVAQSSTPCTTITTVVTAPTITAAPTVLTCSSQAMSFKAHMLNVNKLANQQQAVVTKPVAPIVPSQTIVQNIVKPPMQAIQQGLNLQIPPGRVVSPSLSPRAKQAAQLVAANGKQGQPMSPVLNNTGAPPNPKQHLLQAAKQQTSTIVNMPQKLPLHSINVNLVSAAPRIHQPVSQATALKGINGQPHPLNPKTHLLQAVVPTMVTGTVASSVTQPHLVNPQSIAGGVSCGRPSGTPKPTVGTMEPQKMEVPMSGCIMVPTASAQPRSVPMSPYEAPLHGSASATPPGSQYSLVPHRSQSPPLPPPAHHHTNASQGDVVNHYGGLPRGGELTPHYMFQYQYLRAQEALATPRIAYHIPGTRSPHLSLDPKLEGGIEDSHSPPLELRRATRTPQERTTDSPQVAQVYMLHGAMRLQPPPQYNAGSNPSLPGAPAGARTTYYDPPPAHIRSQYPMTASEAPTDRAITPDRSRKHQVVTPPHASQVPPQADSFQMLLQRYPVMWQGLLALKNDQAAVQMHFVFGNPNVARDSLPCNSDGSTPPLRIAQRMRLEQTQVEGVARKMQTDNEHCMLLALPCGRDEVDVLQQSKNLQTGFIMYLQQKQAAGIVNIAAPGSQQPAYVVHIFPSCDFANESLARIAPDLLHRVAKIAHLLIVIATV